MAIADKLAQIAENQQKVYKAGYMTGLSADASDAYNDGFEDSFNYLVDESKIIKKIVSGTAIHIDDVSEITHKCVVGSDSDTTVSVFGKNLFDISRVASSAYGSVTNNGNGSITVKEGGSGGVSGATPNTLRDYAPGLQVGKTYTLSAQTTGSKKYIYLRGYQQTWAFGNKLTMTETILNSSVLWYIDADSTGTISNIQIEENNIATAYEPYQRHTYNISAGKSIEIDSLCPIMNVISDADITLNYHRSWGMQAEYDRFWDIYQRCGTRTNYYGGFMGTGWNTLTELPKYGAQPKYAYMMFGYGSYNMDLDDIFTNRGLTLDFSQCTNFNYCFQSSNITAIGTIDMSSAIEQNSVFASPYLKTIRNLIPPAIAFTATAFNEALENLTIGGAITKNINLSQCSKLTAASVQSVLDHLGDLTG